jgi:omega-amidase
MQDLSVTLIQSDLAWENIPANIEAFNQKIDGITEPTDLIILPEMFTTGFSMRAKDLAEDMNGSAATWIMEKAKCKQADIMGSAIIKEKGRYYNRVLWAKSDGRLLTYDKKHLFRMIGEQKIYTAGDGHLTVALKGWKLRPFICYDMRFPIWTRNIGNPYDVAVFIANWPEKRAAQWKILMPARAVENQCYVIGVNRVGTDGKGFYHSGDSSIIDPYGNVVFHRADSPCIHTVSLSYAPVKSYREKFPAWMDADRDLAGLPPFRTGDAK